MYFTNSALKTYGRKMGRVHLNMGLKLTIQVVVFHITVLKYWLAPTLLLGSTVRVKVVKSLVKVSESS